MILGCIRSYRQLHDTFSHCWSRKEEQLEKEWLSPPQTCFSLQNWSMFSPGEKSSWEIIIIFNYKISQHRLKSTLLLLLLPPPHSLPFCKELPANSFSQLFWILYAFVSNVYLDPLKVKLSHRLQQHRARHTTDIKQIKMSLVPIEMS